MARIVTIAVEGPTDAAIARRLLQEAGYERGPEYVRGGKNALDQRLGAFNNAARFSCWLVLRDLDKDASCAPTLAASLLSRPAPHIRLHIIVRAVEAWLLADAEAFSSFFSVAISRIPAQPEILADPKDTLLQVVRHSRKQVIRSALIPRPGTTAKVGPGYSGLLIQFITDHWRPEAADERSQSLARLRRFLRGRASR